MKVWLYGRLSNDDDAQRNSLENQLQILRDYAELHQYEVVGESWDDNVSGMRFDRKGLEQVTQAAEAGTIQAVLVKDLSRLGRHRTQTALLIDWLRQCGVAVLSVTENLNTLSDGDDLLIGIRGVMNDFYAKDIGNKIRHGYRQKQKEGLVISPPFGYWKDRNTNQILLHPEASETVQLVFDLYLSGKGQKEIARVLNHLKRKTPNQLRQERCGKEKTCHWTYQSIRNILDDPSYTGTLVNHKTETHNRTITAVPEDAQVIHENYYPQIIPQENWELVQKLLKSNLRSYSGNRRTHRYAGLLTCGDCGRTFIPKIRCWNGRKYVAYVCNGYMHHGKEFCSTHSIREDKIDAQVREAVEALRDELLAEYDSFTSLRKQYDKSRPAVDAKIRALTAEREKLEQEIESIVMEKISKEP